MGSRLCKAEGKRRIPRLPAEIWRVAEDRRDLDRVPTPLLCKCMAAGADRILRPNESAGMLCEAVLSIVRGIGPVPPDSNWRERISRRSGRCEMIARIRMTEADRPYHYRDGVAIMQHPGIAHACAHPLPCQFWVVVSRSFYPVWMPEGVGASPTRDPRARYFYCSSSCPWRRVQRLSQDPWLHRVSKMI